jgi:hypothetical protein
MIVSNCMHQFVIPISNIFCIAAIFINHLFIFSFGSELCLKYPPKFIAVAVVYLATLALDLPTAAPAASSIIPSNGNRRLGENGTYNSSRHQSWFELFLKFGNISEATLKSIPFN